MRKLLAIAALSFAAACSDAKTAARALDDAGYTDIETLGWSLFAGCGRDDMFTTRFRAKSMKGKTVTGVVCNGWFKGATIRTD